MYESRRSRPRTALIWSSAQTGDNHPSYLIQPDDLPRVALDVENSVHYGTNNPQHVETDWEIRIDAHEWYKLGPRMHAYAAVMQHDLHCLDIFHRALVVTDSRSRFGHVQHCLNYLRQVILCDPDLTLEDVDALEVDHDLVRQGTTRVCRDWSAVWRESERAENEWQAFIKSNWA